MPSGLFTKPTVSSLLEDMDVCKSLCNLNIYIYIVYRLEPWGWSWSIFQEYAQVVPSNE